MFLVFFFKQKTAYEMRISDWSSDLCSSDLTDTPDKRRGTVGERGKPRRTCHIHQHEGRTPASMRDVSVPPTTSPSSPLASEVDRRRTFAIISHQIGRASCRERVCQYV